MYTTRAHTQTSQGKLCYLLRVIWNEQKIDGESGKRQNTHIANFVPMAACHGEALPILMRHDHGPIRQSPRVRRTLRVEDLDTRVRADVLCSAFRREATFEDVDGCFGGSGDDILAIQ